MQHGFLDRASLALSRHAWLVLVTMALMLGAAVAFWTAQRRLEATHAALAPVLRGLKAQDGTRLCGNVDVQVRKTAPHGDAMALLRRLDTVIVDGPDAAGLIRLRIFARDPAQALVSLQRSPLISVVTALPFCK